MASQVKIAISKAAMDSLTQVHYATRLKKSTEAFFLKVIDLLKENVGSPITRQTLIEELTQNSPKPVSASRISQLLGELTELGVFTRREIKSNEGIETVYYIESFESLKSLPERKSPYTQRTRNSARRTEISLRENGDNFLEDTRNPIARHIHDQIFAGILDAGMRLSAKDTRKTILTEMTIAGQPITIRTSTRTQKGDEIALMSDLRLVRILLAWARSDLAIRAQKVEASTGDKPKPQELSNIFSVSAYSLAEAMGLARNQPNNIDNVVAMINRLATTEYEVDATNSPWFMENFSFRGDSEIMRFRFLNNLEIVKDLPLTQDMFLPKREQYKARFFSFSFDPRTFAALALDAIDRGGYMFNSHAELRSERSGILQRFYNWARAYVGGTYRKAIEERWLTMEEMHSILVPSTRLDNFRRYFLRALEDKCIQGSVSEGLMKALVYGYFITVKKESREWAVNIQRDLSDPIVGLDSKHQQLLRAERSLLSS